MLLRYAEHLIRLRVQPPFRAPTDMGFWENSLRIVKWLCKHGCQSVRHLATQAGVSKRCVHRLTLAMGHRHSAPASLGWETADGRQGLTRLVVVMLSSFGLQRGVEP